MYDPGESSKDALLLSIHRHRVNNLHKVGKHIAPQPIPSSKQKNSSQRQGRQGNGNVRTEQESLVWEKINKNTFLSREINDQYGGQARKRATENYGWHAPEEEDPYKPRLIDEVMSNRVHQYQKQQDNQFAHLMKLSDERTRLIEARKKLEEEKRNFRGPSPLKPITPDYQAQDSFYSEPDWNQSKDRLYIEPRSESSQNVMGVESFIRKTKENIPYDTQRVNKLRNEFQAQYNKLYKPYNGELGPQSYENWELDDYYMVREIVDDFVDRFLDNYFRVLPPAIDTGIAQAMISADSREWENRRRALMETKVLQLIMEEIILEETSLMAEETVQEFMNIWEYVFNKSNVSFMNTAEIIATMDTDGRSSEDASYNLVTKGYYALQKDRDRQRQNVWSHTQHIHFQGKQYTDDDDEDDDDVLILDPKPISPMDMRENNPLPLDTALAKLKKSNYVEYLQREVSHWTNMVPSVYSVNISSRCKGVNHSKVSPSQRFLAVASVHGDVTIYDLHWEPIRPIGAVHNHAKTDDPVVSLAWSADSTKLVTGNLIVWSTKATDDNKTDSKVLDLKKDSLGIFPSQFTPVLIMDGENHDFEYHAGPLADHGAINGVFGPARAVFHPCMSFFGQQYHVCVALENNDIIKCDFEELMTAADDMPYQEHPKIHQSTVIPADSQRSYIGQDVPAELFRKHRVEIILMGFIDNFSDMVTVDKKAYVSIWRYKSESLSNYGWYEPYSKHRLEMSKIMYQPTSNVQPNILFTDRQQGGKKARSRQEIAKGRQSAEKQIASLNLKDPWHQEYLDAQNIMTYIYPPSAEVPDSGAMFHVIMRHADGNQLSTYLTRIYKPIKVSSTKLLSVLLTPTGDQLVFVLLFPEYPPKEAHVSVFVLDLHTMELRDFRRDIIIDDNSLYRRCLEDDIISCAVSPVLGSTGGYYLFVNLAGQLSGYSMNTGMKILRTEDPKRVKFDSFGGCRLNASSIPLSLYSKLVVAGTIHKMFIIAYANKRDKNNANKLLVVELTDQNSEEDRAETWASFTKWHDHPVVPEQGQRINPEDTTVDGQHRAAFMSSVVMDIVDQIIQQRHNNYSQEEAEEYEENDRVDNYKRLLPEVVQRRRPTGDSPDQDDDNDPVNPTPAPESNPSGPNTQPPSRLHTKPQSRPSTKPPV